MQKWKVNAACLFTDPISKVTREYRIIDIETHNPIDGMQNENAVITLADVETGYRQWVFAWHIQPVIATEEI